MCADSAVPSVACSAKSLIQVDIFEDTNRQKLSRSDMLEHLPRNSHTTILNFVHLSYKRHRSLLRQQLTYKCVSLKY